jgi:GT2 family glycosyltransferase
MPHVSAGEAPLLSIVTVTWNAPEWAARLYRSLPAQTSEPYELIVVDNASDQPTRQLNAAEAAAGRMRVVQNEENLLWAPACNQGLEIVDPRSRYVLLLNPDCEILRSDWVAQLSSVLAADPRVAVTGTALNWKRIGPVFGCVDGSIFFMRREAFDEIGMLDAERYPWNGSPYDWCARAWARGWLYRRCANVPPFLVHHEHKSVVESGVEHPWRRIDVEEMYRRAGLVPRRPHRATLWLKRRSGLRRFFDPDAPVRDEPTLPPRTPA